MTDSKKKIARLKRTVRAIQELVREAAPIVATLIRVVYVVVRCWPP